MGKIARIKKKLILLPLANELEMKKVRKLSQFHASARGHDASNCIVTASRLDSIALTAAV